MRSFRIFILLIATLATGLRAQDSWTAVTQTATTQNLWSIAFGNRVLVACGEQGTILSYDYGAFGIDQAWLSRASGTNVWLVGAGFGNGRFVVVGDLGTILTSDDGGVTWTPRASGTITRLNAAAYGNGRWLVVGEQGVVLTSTDGTTWSTRPALGTGFLRALAFGQGQFLVGGAGGALFSTTDATTFTPVAIATTSNIEGAAISDNHFWLVGSNGLRASATSLGTWTFGFPRQETYRGVSVRNLDGASAVGESASDTFVVYPSGPAWAGNFAALNFLATAVVQGENDIIAVGFGGNIAHSSPNITLAFVTSDQPAIYGHDVHFNLLTSLPVTSVQWTRGGVDIPGATQTSFVIPNITPAQTGAIGVRATSPGVTSTIGGSALKLLPAGRPDVRDPNFVSALPGLPTLVVPQPDGKILAAGAFSVALNGGASYGLVRLNGDGSLDQTFRAGTGIPTATSISAIHLLPDGRIYVRGNFPSIAGQARPGLARLLATGALDTTFNPPASLASSTIYNSALAPDGRLYLQTDPVNPTIQRLALDGSRDASFPPLAGHKLIGVDSRGRVLAVKYDAPTYYGIGSLVRYSPDGSLDGSYTPTRVVAEGVDGVDLSYPVVTDSGIYATSSLGRIGVSFSHKRYKPDGGLDSTYQAPTATGTTDYSSPFRADGAYWNVAQGYSFGGVYQPILYGPSGAPDPSSYATLADASQYRVLAYMPDGSLLATHQDPTQQSLIRIRTITGRVSRLTNLSVRAFVTGDPLIAGFVTTGSDTTNALVRAIGPGLAQFGVNDAPRDPQLALVRDSTTVTNNDDWNASLAPRFASVGAFGLPPGSKDAALEASIGAGNYTGVVTTPSGDTGTALVELYQTSDPFASLRRVVNVSARGTVDAAHPLIAGFTITGDVPLTVLIRGSGPALAAAPFNLGGTLADPQLKLYHDTTALWENDNWTNDLADTARRAGAFAFANNSKDSAMLVTLAPGSYTAVLTGVNNTSGTALVEVYEAP